MTTIAGFVLVAVLWAVLLVPIVRGLIRFVRTTRPSDLLPRITRVQHGVGPLMVVSGERASFDPTHWEQISPWCWRKRA